MVRLPVVLLLLPGIALGEAFNPDSFNPDSFNPDAFPMDVDPGGGGGSGEGSFDSESWDTESFDTESWEMDGGEDINEPIDGAKWTEFTTSVPSDAVYYQGTAHATTGEMYVATCSTVGAYVGGVAHKGDGAMCIVTSGTYFTDKRGYGVTQEGKVLSDECVGDIVTQGIPRRSSDNYVCMTDTN